MAGRVYTSRRLAHVCQVRSGGDLLLLLLACSRWLPIFVIVSYSIFIAVQCPWLEVDPGPGTGFEVGISVVGLCALGEPLSMNDFFFYFHFFSFPVVASLCCSCAATIIVISRANKLVNNKYFSVKYC